MNNKNKACRLDVTLDKSAPPEWRGRHFRQHAFRGVNRRWMVISSDIEGENYKPEKAGRAARGKCPANSDKGVVAGN